MRRTGLLILTVAGLAGAAGCRSTCGENEGLFHRMARNRAETPARFGDRGCGDCDALATSAGRLAPGAPAGWELGQGPVYPVGEPFPLRAGAGAPENELPLPRITPPGVPEGSLAQPLPAAPNAALLPAPGAKSGVETKQAK